MSGTQIGQRWLRYHKVYHYKLLIEVMSVYSSGGVAGSGKVIQTFEDGSGYHIGDIYSFYFASDSDREYTYLKGQDATT
jgi:hypothetical protein